MLAASSSSSEAEQILRLLAWLFVPPIATAVILRVWRMCCGRCRRGGRGTAPAPSSQYAHERNYRYVFTLVIVAYLAAESFLSSSAATTTASTSASPTANDAFRSPSYYTRLGVSSGTDFDQRQMKSAFRRLSLRFHPDKNPSTEAEETFQLIRKAYETLNHPMKRRVYDAFGEVDDCQNCKTFADFFYTGLLRQAGFYVSFGVFMLLHQMMSGRGKKGQQSPSSSTSALSPYWRWLGLLALASYELGVVTGSVKSPALVSYLLGGGAITVRERVNYARQLFISLSMALSQLTPLWYPVLAATLAGRRVTMAAGHNTSNGGVPMSAINAEYDEQMGVPGQVQLLSRTVDEVGRAVDAHERIACGAFEGAEPAVRQRVVRQMEKLVAELQAADTSATTKLRDD